MLLLSLVPAVASESEVREHRIEDRLEFARVELPNATANLVIGPCSEDCAVVLEANRSALPVYTFFHGKPQPNTTYTVSHDPGSIHVQIAEDHQFNMDWAPLPKLLSVPLLHVHVVSGYEHLFDDHQLVTLDGTPKSIWSGTRLPRDQGSVAVGLGEIGGQPAWIERSVVDIGDGTDQWEVNAVRASTDGKTLVRIPAGQVPVYAVIAATRKAPEEARAARSNAACLREFSVVSTEGLPKLKSGLAIVARLTGDAAEAGRWLTEAKACQPDAYLKRGR